MSSLDDLECPVCFNIFVQPRILPCGHTYCQDCIRQLIRAQSVECPEDRKDHKVPKKGAESFPINYSLKRQIDRLCRQCKKEKPETECPHCSEQLCQMCIAFHLNHQDAVRELANLQAMIEQSDALLKQESQDFKHNKNTLDKQIDKAGHELHKLVDTRIMELKTAAENNYGRQNEWCRSLGAHLATIKKKHSSSSSQLGTKFREEVTNEFMSEVKAQCGRDATLLTDSRKLIPNSVSFTLKWDNTKLCIGQFGTIGESGSKSGRLVKPGKPRVIGEKGKGPARFRYPYDVSQCPVSGHLLVADYFNQRIQILDEEGGHVTDITQDGQGRRLEVTWSVCVTQRGDVVVRSGDRVFMYSGEGVYRRRLEGPLEAPRCVASCGERVYMW